MVAIGTEAGGERLPIAVEGAARCPEAAELVDAVEFRNVVKRVGVGGTCAVKTRRMLSPLLMTEGSRGIVIENLPE